MATDHFATLGQRRRLWIDAGELKETFHALTAEQHPDKAGGHADFALMNAAYAVLRDPAARLRHLLELEEPAVLAATATSIPETLGELFMRIATLRGAADAFVKEQAGATTPVAQALLASERFTLQRDLERELAALEGSEAEHMAWLQRASEAWEARDAALVEATARVQQEMSFRAKWSGQLREALFQLANPPG